MIPCHCRHLLQDMQPVNVLGSSSHLFTIPGSLSRGLATANMSQVLSTCFSMISGVRHPPTPITGILSPTDARMVLVASAKYPSPFSPSRPAFASLDGPSEGGAAGHQPDNSIPFNPSFTNLDAKYTASFGVTPPSTPYSQLILAITG